MDREFFGLVERARAAVIVKDEGGYCVHANRLEEELRGVAPKELLGKHVTELVDADPSLVEREWQRFRRERVWVGDYRTHDATGQLIGMRSCNFVHREWDGRLLYVSFGYVLKPGPSNLPRATTSEAAPLTAEDRCLLQLCVDGYSEEEIALLFGATQDTVCDLIARLLQRAGAKSRTEVCVRALKSHLVA